VTLDLLFEAMAHHQLNQPNEARSAMEQATKLIDEYLAQSQLERGIQWNDWLMCQIVRREAEELLGVDAEKPKNTQIGRED
jgi:hypothetical protein